jgi:pilus assembly protein CpaF
MSLLKRIERSQQPGDSEPKSSGSTSIRPKVPEQQARRAPAASHVRDAFKDLKERIQDKLVAELDPAMDVSRTDEVRRTIQDMFEQILAQENIILIRS